MKKAVLFLILMFNVQGFIVSCGCPDENYMDFNSILLQPDDNLILNDEFFNMNVTIEDMQYITSNEFSHFSYQANATTVCEEGRDGFKFPIVNVSIFSDSDFNSDHPAGTDLREIFKAYGFYNYTGNGSDTDYDYISELDQAHLIGTFYVLELRPDLDLTHRFEVRLEKVNGDIVTGFSDEITWE